ncbi:hypothetical protein [Xanthomonas sp. A1809]|uniref:hypothetical protein n=1 Tax=Xanthomonas sp. A1809 TaxID=2821275 RepID=UPI001ADB8DF4|nr:hypothetical protein [Xanthomonas sp. A1809]MBO9859389.1 hypothetical protein [Xanthomonas sp. A1809]
MTGGKTARLREIDMKYMALKGFLDPSGYQKRGTEWTGSPERAKELLRGGLIAEFDGAKAAPTAENKMAPPAKNKGRKAPTGSDKA